MRQILFILLLISLLTLQITGQNLRANQENGTPKEDETNTGGNNESQGQNNDSTKPGESQNEESTKPGESQNEESTKPGENQNEESTKPGESQNEESTKPGESQNNDSTKSGDNPNDESTKQDQNQGNNQNQNNQGQNQGSQGFIKQENSNEVFGDMNKNSFSDFNDMNQKAEEFKDLSQVDQKMMLENQTSIFGNLMQGFGQKTQPTQEERKEVMGKASEIASLLSQKNCSSVAESTSDLFGDENFTNCREEKKNASHEILDFVKNYVKCEDLDTLINEGVSDDKKTNLEYVVYLIYELSSNPDSFQKGESEILYNITLCLQQNFTDVWKGVEENITIEENANYTKKEAKHDISLILIKTLSNLINIQRYDEMDGNLNDTEKDLSDHGIMRNEQAKNIQKGMIDFAKQFHDFEDGNQTYNISDSMNISILKFNDLNDKTLEDREQVYNLSDQGIVVKFKPRKMVNDSDEVVFQFMVFESPLVPLSSENNESNIVGDFISLSIFDKNGDEINITDLPEGSMLEIYYNQTESRDMKDCFFYNQSNEDLDDEGMVPQNDTTLVPGQKYLKCSSKHLTSFTASYSSSSSSASASTSSSISTSGDDTGSNGDTNSGNYLSFMILYCLLFITWI